MAHAALMGAGYNVRVNLSGLNESATSDTLKSELSDLEAKAVDLDNKVHYLLQTRGGLNLV